MSMEDIFKALVDSRQQGSAKSGVEDPMMGLIGGLLGGTQQGSSQQQAGLGDLMGGLLGGVSQPAGGQQQAGLSNMMGLLESVIGGQGTGQSALGANDPLMGLLQPFVTPLAKKVNIPPEIAVIVVSFVARKLLAHHPNSGRDSREFDFDDMLQQMSSGNINQDLLHSSGMVNELSKATGLDQQTTTKALSTAFTLVGKQFQGSSPKISSPAKPSASAPVKTLKGKGSSSKAK